MRKLMGFLVVAVLFPAMAFAEETRVIEEEIVLKDPTVAQAGNWAAGGSMEGWYSSGPYYLFDENHSRIAKGTIAGGMMGGNLFLGRGDWTMQTSYRSGTFGVNWTYTNDRKSTDVDNKQTEFEITARRLWKWKKHVSPYGLVGYNRLTRHWSETITNKGNNATGTWPYNGNATYAYHQNYDSGLVGVGAIFPVNQYWGLRADGRVLLSRGKYLRDDGRKLAGWGGGVAGTLTGYVNIIQGLNLQLGIKGQALGAKNVGGYNVGGYFGSLGYSYKF